MSKRNFYFQKDEAFPSLGIAFCCCICIVARMMELLWSLLSHLVLSCVCIEWSYCTCSNHDHTGSLLEDLKVQLEWGEVVQSRGINGTQLDLIGTFTEFTLRVARYMIDYIEFDWIGQHGRRVLHILVGTHNLCPCHLVLKSLSLCNLSINSYSITMWILYT
jgi:hypothetical protein